MAAAAKTTTTTTTTTSTSTTTHCLLFELLSLFLNLAMMVSGWSVTIFNLAFTSFNLNWTELSAVVNQSAKFYLVEIKSIQGTILAVETVPGNVTSTVIEGLSPSTKYHVGVYGVDSIGQPYKSLETAITTTIAGGLICVCARARVCVCVCACVCVCGKFVFIKDHTRCFEGFSLYLLIRRENKALHYVYNQQIAFATFLNVFVANSYGYLCSLSLVTCGSRPSTSRIVGGTAAPVNSWPWQVMVMSVSDHPFCGGALVDPYWVVTTAGCMTLAGVTPSSIKIR